MVSTSLSILSAFTVLWPSMDLGSTLVSSSRSIAPLESTSNFSNIFRHHAGQFSSLCKSLQSTRDAKTSFRSSTPLPSVSMADRSWWAVERMGEG